MSLNALRNPWLRLVSLACIQPLFCCASQTNCLPRIQWQRTYGGSGFEAGSAILQMKDGGYILGSTSSSSPSGNKTSPNYGSNDFWVVRLNRSGEKVWEKTFGGIGNDYLAALRQTSDGGFILGGRSDSPPSGNKTSPNYGSSDFWIVRLSTSGEKLWEESFG